MRARLRSWWQKNKQLLIIVAVAIIVVLAVFALAVYELGWGWTGFKGKTLWDWLQLLIIPVVLAIGGFWLNSKLQKTIEDQKLVQRQYVDITTYAQEQSDSLIKAYLRLYEREGATATGEAFAKIALEADNDLMKPFRKYYNLLDDLTKKKIFHIHNILVQFQNNPSPNTLERFRKWKDGFIASIEDARSILQPELILYRKKIIGSVPYEPQGGSS